MIKKFICLILLLVCISCSSKDKDTYTGSDEILLEFILVFAQLIQRSNNIRQINFFIIIDLYILILKFE